MKRQATHEEKNSQITCLIHVCVWKKIFKNSRNQMDMEEKLVTQQQPRR